MRRKARSEFLMYCIVSEEVDWYGFVDIERPIAFYTRRCARAWCGYGTSSSYDDYFRRSFKEAAKVKLSI
jgi:hypothetical protein